ncbi:MAG: hypothetical protein IK038_02945 [Bacteroidaceae bacterium]|nr:hypothetical protein [Bacteroidaceae bacterium]
MKKAVCFPSIIDWQITVPEEYTRYAASGIVTSFEFDTRVMICEEVE